MIPYGLGTDKQMKIPVGLACGHDNAPAETGDDTQVTNCDNGTEALPMTIQLNPEQERLIGQAIQAGVIETPSQVVDAGVETIRRQLEAREAAGTSPLTGDEWIRKFRAWASGHPTNTPLLSDEAVGRESIYRERGL